MAENVTYTLLCDLKTGSELGRANLNSPNAPSGVVNLLQELPQNLTTEQSIEIVLHVFEDLSEDDKMDLSTLTTSKLEGRLINSTDAAVELDAAVVISGTGDYIATATVDKDVIPSDWGDAGTVRLFWTFEDASKKLQPFQDYNFTNPEGTGTPASTSGLNVNDGSTTVQPTSEIEFTSGATVTDAGNGKAQVAISTGSPTPSEVFLSVHNGFGSSGTSISRWSTVDVNTGSDLTLTQDATNGDSVTVETAGWYEVEVTRLPSAVTNFGLSVNASSLSGAIQTLAKSEQLAVQVVALASNYWNVTVTRYFEVNDIIRAHDGGGQASGSASAEFFRVQGPIV